MVDLPDKSDLSYWRIEVNRPQSDWRLWQMDFPVLYLAPPASTMSDVDTPAPLGNRNDRRGSPIVLAQDTFRNVPEVAVAGWVFRTPANTAPECYLIEARPCLP